MKLLRKIDQIRRDFWGDYECEGCGAKENNVSGYDDDYFHSQVIPKRKCKKCGESSKTLGIENEPVQTRYAAQEVV